MTVTKCSDMFQFAPGCIASRHQIRFHRTARNRVSGSGIRLLPRPLCVCVCVDSVEQQSDTVLKNDLVVILHQSMDVVCGEGLRLLSVSLGPGGKHS